ncbi:MULTISPECIES: hypothetical protein [Cysteiniphilum]|uniref:Uncharacterized protein n=1 Tax=Cysteiniphilum litorale TaxID=2056700 RepID=A0A8J3EAM2_9GAMM|nr:MULTISPECIES: hypothetical protein [Cysteiniphilum]GGG06977.1 hypothetical protein GCM10010995_25610 [Cysteiniphilum litorale]
MIIITTLWSLALTVFFILLVVGFDNPKLNFAISFYVLIAISYSIFEYFNVNTEYVIYMLAGCVVIIGIVFFSVQVYDLFKKDDALREN